MFEYYDCINKVPEYRYKEMSKILNNFSIELHGQEWYEQRRERFEGEGFNYWLNTITNDPNYHIILYIVDNNIVGFINYQYLDNNQVAICEAQIIKEYRYKGLVKVLLSEMMKQIDPSRCEKFVAGIFSKNEHSINTFTHIGMQLVDNHYEIPYDVLKQYTDKNAVKK